MPLHTHPELAAAGAEHWGGATGYGYVCHQGHGVRQASLYAFYLGLCGTAE